MKIRTLNRRQFIQHVGIGTIATSGLTSCWVPTSPENPDADPSPEGEEPDSEKSPNIVIIMTDEHNFRTLSCYRNLMSEEQANPWGTGNNVDTPHIDWIAQNGAICDSFYATSPVCTPSRGAWMSGQYPHQNGAIKNDKPIKTELKTFAHLLNDHGYHTGYLGKWHLAGNSKPGWAPENNGGFSDHRYMFNRGHWKQFEDTPEGPRVKARTANDKPSSDIEGADENSFSTDFLTNKAIAFIEANKESPFCCFLCIADPHGPDTVRAPYDKMFTHLNPQMPRTSTKDKSKAPNWAKPYNVSVSKLPQYLGMVKCIDDNVGKVLSTLKNNQLIDNTIVIFTSDHGDLFGEHGRHNKGNPFEASARVPFIIHYKDVIQANTLVNETMCGVDFLPTLTGLLGLNTSGSATGQDSSHLFKNTETPLDWSDTRFLRGTENWIAAISDRYKLVISKTDQPWLFDLEENPDEITNFIRDPTYRPIVKRLGAALKDYCLYHEEPHFEDSFIKADLEWASGDQSGDQIPSRPET